MNPSNERLKTLNEFYKNLTKEYCKHAVLMDKRTRNQHRNKKAVLEAYMDISKAMGLQSEKVLKKKLDQMQNYAMSKIRGYFKNSLRLYTIDEAIKRIPDWMKQLEEPFGLIERTYNMLTASTKAFNSRKYREIRLIIDLIHVIEGRLKNASCAMEASKVLTCPDTISDFAKSIDVPVEKLCSLWNDIYQQAKAKLFLYMEEGDNVDKILGQAVRFTNVDKKAIDLGLLYDVRLRALQKGISTSLKKLESVILLFKLIVAAKKKHAMLLWERGERSSYKENREESVEMWALVYFEYTRRGRWASPILLQRRWYELKQLARYRFLYARTGTQAPPHILLLAIVRRFPYIVTETLPTWNELVRNNQVFMDWDFTKFNFDPQILMADVPKNISENDLIDELNDSDDDVEIIEKEQEVIEIDDLDDEPSPKKVDNETEASIALLEKIDPDKAKVRIIFEDGEDIDTELENFKRKKDDNFNSFNHLKEEEDGDKVNTSGVIVKIEHLGIEKLDEINDTSLPEERREQSDVNDSDNDGGGDIKNAPPILDNKLMQLPRVVLTPLEDLQLWRKYSKNNSIKCRQFSVRKLSKLVSVTPDQLAKARLYKKPTYIPQSKPVVASKTKTGVKYDKVQELNRLCKFKSKRKLLTKSLKLPRTYFSATFWNERNIKLLECCQPVSVTLERVARNRKKVELANIDEVRRINKMILTAQVAPLPVEPKVTKMETTDLTEDYSSVEIIKNNSLPNMVIPTEQEVKNILRTYCTVVNDMKIKGIPTLHYHAQSEESNKDQLIMSCLCLKTKIDKQLTEIADSIYHKKPRKSKKKGNQSKNINTSSDASSVDEWQRQKNQNLQYFNFKPASKENGETLRTYNKNCLKRPSETVVTPKHSKTDGNNIIESKSTGGSDLPDDSDDLIICETNDRNIIELSDTDDDVTAPKENQTNNNNSKLNINTSNVNVNENLSNVNIGDINKILNYIHKNDNDNDTNSKNSNANIPVDPKANAITINNSPVMYVLPPYVVNSLNPDTNVTNTKVSSEQSPIMSPTKINIRVVKNCFEINGHQNEPSTSQPVGETHNVLSLLSKIAYKIQGTRNTPEKVESFPPNPRSLLRINPLNSIAKASIPNYTPTEENPPINNTLYYVVQVPNKHFVPNRSSMPVIEKVESISEVDHNKLINDKTQVTPTSFVDITEDESFDSEKTNTFMDVNPGKVKTEVNTADSLDSDKKDGISIKNYFNGVDTDLCLDKTNDDKVKDNIEIGDSIDDKEMLGDRDKESCKEERDCDKIQNDSEDINTTKSKIDNNDVGKKDKEDDIEESNVKSEKLESILDRTVNETLNDVTVKDEEDNTEESIVKSERVKNDLNGIVNVDDLCIDDTLNEGTVKDKEDNKIKSEEVGSDLNKVIDGDSELCIESFNVGKVKNKEDNIEETKVESDFNRIVNYDSHLCIDEPLKETTVKDEKDDTEESIVESVQVGRELNRTVKDDTHLCIDVGTVKDKEDDTEQSHLEMHLDKTEVKIMPK